MIDLRSDTVTRPTADMWEAIRSASLDDDTLEGDRTVQRLERAAAELLDKDDALFVCSGTMGNVIAALAHAGRGGEVVLDQDSHMANAENGGVSRLANLFCRALPSHRGEMDIDTLRRTVRGKFSRHGEPTAFVGLETSHNASGGCVQPLAYFETVAAITAEAGVALHIDGARLFNAALALEVEPALLVGKADSVSVCLSKGLSAPMGALLLGDRAFIERARIFRRTVGGGLRQAGPMAAAGLVALTSMRARLAEDHELTKRLWRGLQSCPLVTLDKTMPQTNILRIGVQGMDAVSCKDMLRRRGVAVRDVSARELRLVVHRHITTADIDNVIAAFTTDI